MKSNFSRRIICLLLTLAMVLSLLPTVFADDTNPFTDVAEGKYYYDAVLWAVNHDPQITNGTSDTTFSPNATCTRGQVVTFLWRAMGTPEPASTEHPFVDLNEKAFYYKAVLWAVEKNITNGSDSTHFNPSGKCTRGHVVTFQWRAAGEPEPKTTENPFVDLKEDAFYYKAVLWAVENGITNGADATHFNPTGACTRGQVVTFLWRQLKDQGLEDLTGKTIILHTNDTHGALMGFAQVAAVKKQYEAAGATVLLVDAGDYSQGTTYVSTNKGAAAITMLNATGYDYVTLGNHEFDFGYAQLIENMKAAEFKPIVADVLLKETGKPIFDGHVIKEVNGVKIGFFGMETPETFTKVNPGLIQEITFPQGEEMYACAQAEVDALKEEGADLIIGLVHLGVDPESEPNRSVDLYKHVEGIDFLIDGHSHTVMTEGPDGEPIQSTGTKASKTAFENVGLIQIDNETKKIEKNELIPLGDDAPVDEEVAAIAQEIMDKVDEEYGAKFAESLVELNGDRAPGNRNMETNLGDLITDSMLWGVLKDMDAETLGVPEENVLAITNGGGIRAWIHKGDVTKNDVNTVLPFGNTVAVVYVTGAELLEALEASTYCTPTSIGGFPQVAGIQFNIDTEKAYDQGEQYPDSTYYGPASIQRVTIDNIGGKPFDPEATYAVVTNNFCAAGGDTYYAFKAASKQFDTGIPLDEMLINYITEELNGVIGEDYAEPKGRITQESPKLDYYLVGWINGADYGCESDWENLGEYKFVDGKLTATFNEDSYVFVKTGDNAGWFMTDGWLGTETTSATLYNTASYTFQDKADKLYVPGNTAINFTLTENEDGTLTLAYEKALTAVETVFPSTSNDDIAKYGNISTDLEAADFFAGGFTWGDIATVEFLDKTMDLPIVPTFSYVDQGTAGIFVNKNGETGEPTGRVFMAINMGDFATSYGLATKTTNADKTYYWTAVEGVEFPVPVKITLKEAGGYATEMAIRDINRTNNREDYPELTDAEFANFRQITTTGMGDHLYRGSSPINPEIGRNTYADAELEKAGVTVIMNLANDQATAEGYEGYADTYYSKQNIIFLNLGVDFQAADFQAGLANGLKHFASNKGVYYVHCTEGKDRAGFVSALLECFMGATYDEVVADYLKTYTNYYTVVDGKQQPLSQETLDAIANSNIIKTLQTAFGVDDLKTADLAKEAEEYIQQIGLNDEEIANLRTNLGGTTGPVNTEFEFLVTSDIHGQIYATDYTRPYEQSGTYSRGLTRVSTYIKEQKAAFDDNVYVVDMGDTFQGAPLTYYYAFNKPDVPDPAILAFRTIGYDMWVVGNHEFNYGLPILTRQMDYAVSPSTDTEKQLTISMANYLKAETNSDESKDWATWRDVAPYVIKDFDGYKVAIIGFGNPNIPKWDVPANWEGIYFANIIETYKHYEAEMLEQADMIVVVAHSGIGSDPGSDFIEQLVNETNTIAFAFSGHEHGNKVYNATNKDGKTVPILQPYTKARAIAQVKVTVENGEYSIAPEIKSMENYPLDEALAELLKPYETDTWENYMLQPIGKALGDYPAANLGTAPSAFVDLINTVQTWGGYDRTGENTPDKTEDDTPAMLSITAPLTSGNNANLISEGDIYLGDMFGLYRFENWFYQITMSGEEVHQWLEFAATKIRVDDEGNPYVTSGDLTYYDIICGDGFRYDIDVSKPEGERVVNMTYNGVQVTADQTFTVMVNNYRYNGGGNYVSWLNNHGCEFIANDPDRIIYSTQFDMIQGEDEGQARALLVSYIKDQTEKYGGITPVITSSWTVSNGSVQPALDTAALEAAIEAAEALNPACYTDDTAAALAEALEAAKAAKDSAETQEEIDAAAAALQAAMDALVEQYTRSTELHDGDKVIFLNPYRDNRVIRNETYNNQRLYETMYDPAPGDKIAATNSDFNENQVWTAVATRDGRFQFVNGENAITLINNSYLDLTNNAAAENGLTGWTLETADESTGKFYIRSTGTTDAVYLMATTQRINNRTTHVVKASKTDSPEANNYGWQLYICPTGAAAEEQPAKVETTFPSATKADIDKYGDVHFSITSADLAAAGFEYADLVKLTFLDQEVIVPVIPQYRYVGAKAAGLVMWEDGTKPAEVEVFNGSFAATYGLADVVRDGSEYTVTPREGVEFPVPVTIEMYEKQGYADTYAIFDLTRSNNREDYRGNTEPYPNLTDEEFANFRAVTTTGMGEGKLYRSSSPINPSIGRNTYADKAAEEAGVKSFVNLADSETSAAKYAGYADTYYSKQNIAFLNLGVDFTTELNREGLKTAMEFIADENSEAPFLVHCNEGQDRAGFVSALLECLMGASYDEVVKDYMVTFYNYYGVQPGTDQYTQISNNVIKNLSTAFGLQMSELAEADLAAEAVEYFKELGVSDETIAAVKVKLGPAAAPTGATLRVFETTDVHGYLMDTSSGVEENFQYRLAYIAQIVNNARTSEDYDDVLLFDGGDTYQGTPVSNLLQGKALRAAMDTMGYDAFALGNHEFDWGVTNNADENATVPAYDFGEYKGDPTTPIVCYDLYYADSGEPVTFTKDYVVLEKAGYRIAVVGYIPDYSLDIMAAEINPYTIDPDLAKLKAKVAEINAAEKPDVTVILAHASPKSIANAMDPAEVQLVIGGHSHSGVAGTADNGIAYIQGNCQGQGYASATIEIVGAPGSVSSVTVNDPLYTGITGNDTKPYLLDTEENADKLDPTVLAISHAAWDAVKEQMEEDLGYIDTAITKKGSKLSDNGATTAGNWITGIMLDYMKDKGVVAAFYNSGGIRTSFEIPEGETTRRITAGDIYTINPFCNYWLVYELTGAELAQQLINGMVNGNYGDQMSGLTFTYWQEGSGKNAVRGIVSITLSDGTVVDPTDTETIYRVCTSNYSGTLAGGVFEFKDPVFPSTEAPIDNETIIQILREKKAAGDGYIPVDTTGRGTKVDKPVEPQPAYYLVGDMNDWAPAEGYQLTASTENEGEWVLTVQIDRPVNVKIYDQTNDKWYPDGTGNDYWVDPAGTYDVSFYPAGNVEGYHYGYFKLTKQAATPAYYLVGDMNSWAPAEGYQLTASTENEGEWVLTVEIPEKTNVKVYDQANDLWYPAGTGNDCWVEEGGSYDVSFYPAGNVEGYHEGYFKLTKASASNKFEIVQTSSNSSRFGHLDMNISVEEFLKLYALGDVVTVEVNGFTFDAPVVTNYDDVDTGNYLLRCANGKTVVTLAINYGQIGVASGMLEKVTDAETGNVSYQFVDGLQWPVYATVTLKEAGGYADELAIRKLNRTNNRADYANLSDEEFANFRAVTTTGMGEAVLYRSSSPIDPDLGRNTYADAAARAAGIKVFINLADTEAEAKAFEGFTDSYYATQSVKYLGLPVAFTSDEFKAGLAEGYRYIASNNGPYLIHCLEGKDRTGLSVAVLEALMGATLSEIQADYLKTYENYFDVQSGAQVALTDAQKEVLTGIITKNLGIIFDADLTTANLASEAEAYLTEIGLSQLEITNLKVNLGGKDDDELPILALVP